jgi:DNA gyrase inhibitor GyrI
LPAPLRYEEFAGGKYSRFVLRGPYSNLPMACGRVFEIVEKTKLQRRDDFCIEHYANDPKTTPEDQLITEILIPTL